MNVNLKENECLYMSLILFLKLASIDFYFFIKKISLETVDKIFIFPKYNFKMQNLIYYSIFSCIILCDIL